MLENKEFTIHKKGLTEYYVSNNKNKLNETLVIELTECYDNEICRLWLQRGFTDKLYKSYYNINTYITLDNIHYTNKYEYNISTKMSKDNKGAVIDFNNLYEVSEKNKKHILNSIYSLFNQIV